MCLKAPHDAYEKKFPKAEHMNNYRFGYKIFSKIGDGLFSSRFTRTNTYLPIGIWLHEKDYRPYLAPVWLVFDRREYGTYKTGFHTLVGNSAFNKVRKNLDNYYDDIGKSVIRKVLVKNVLRKGWDTSFFVGRLACVVSRHILILPCIDDTELLERGDIHGKK